MAIIKATAFETPDEEMIYQMYQTIRAYTKTLNNDIGSLGIYSSEWSIINLVKRNGTLPQSKLVMALRVEPAAISKTLTKLEKKGVIERRFLRDKREKFISLTPQAETVFDSLRHDVLSHREMALKGLSPDDRLQLHQLMKKMYQNMEP